MRLVKMQLEEALSRLLESGNPSDSDYLAACSVVVASRDVLPRHVFLRVPSDSVGPAWDAIRAATKEVCDCSDARVIEPLTVRQVFAASALDLVTLEFEKPRYIRPIGAPDIAAIVEVEIVDFAGHLAFGFTLNPFSKGRAGVLSMRTCRMLSVIARDLEEGGRPLAFRKKKGESPIFAFVAATREPVGLTLQLDAAFEFFEPTEAMHMH